MNGDLSVKCLSISCSSRFSLIVVSNAICSCLAGSVSAMIRFIPVAVLTPLYGQLATGCTSVAAANVLTALSSAALSGATPVMWSTSTTTSLRHGLAPRLLRSKSRLPLSSRMPSSSTRSGMPSESRSPEPKLPTAKRSSLS